MNMEDFSFLLWNILLEQVKRLLLYDRAIHLFYYFQSWEALPVEDELLSIKEAVIFTGKCERTIYRYIKKGKLPCQTIVSQMSDSSQAGVRIKKSDLIRVFNITSDTCQTDIRQEPDRSQTPVRDFKEDIKTVIEEYFENKTTQLMKPLEQQALYKLGAVEKENLFLRERLDTLRQENELLREQVKALPDLQTIQEKEKDLIIQIEMERKEKEDLLSMGETIRKEAEEKLKQSEEIHRKELETRNELHRQELQQTWKQAEDEQKNYLATIEELKKRLEAEEKRPWYRRLFF